MSGVGIGDGAVHRVDAVLHLGEPLNEGVRLGRRELLSELAPPCEEDAADARQCHVVVHGQVVTRFAIGRQSAGGSSPTPCLRPATVRRRFGPCTLRTVSLPKPK